MITVNYNENISNLLLNQSKKTIVWFHKSNNSKKLSTKNNGICKLFKLSSSKSRQRYAQGKSYHINGRAIPANSRNKR